MGLLLRAPRGGVAVCFIAASAVSVFSLIRPDLFMVAAGAVGTWFVGLISLVVLAVVLAAVGCVIWFMCTEDGLQAGGASVWALLFVIAMFGGVTAGLYNAGKWVMVALHWSTP